MTRHLLTPLFGAMLLSGVGVSADEKTDAEAELKNLRGTWGAQSIRYDGKDVPAEAIKGMTWVVKDAKVAQSSTGKPDVTFSLKIDPSKNPKALDLSVIDPKKKDDLSACIYKLSGDELTVCMPMKLGEKERPEKFESADSKHALIVFKRQKP